MMGVSIARERFDRTNTVSAIMLWYVVYEFLTDCDTQTEWVIRHTLVLLS